MISEEIAALQKLTYEVDVSIVLHEAEILHLYKKVKNKKILAYNKWMVEEFKDLLFVLNMVNVLRLNNINLFHGLDSHLVGWVLLKPCILNISKGA